MRRNDFINNLIELSIKTYYNKEDAEDLDELNSNSTVCPLCQGT